MKRFVLITGASSGIGLEMAKVFAIRGYDLILVARSEALLKKIQIELEARFNVKVMIFTVDLLDIKKRREFLNQMRDSAFPVDILVNNAGSGRLGEFCLDEIDHHLEMMHLNMDALVELCHFYGKEMKLQGHGRILNVASTAAFEPGPNMSVYYATKAFVLHFSEGLREELLPYGISVTTLCPGPTQTNFFNAGGFNKMNNLAKAFWMQSAHDVALVGVNACLQDRGVIISGFINKIIYNLVWPCPRILIRKIMLLINR